MAEMYFIATRRKKTDRRVDGYFVIPSTGFWCKACSGSPGLAPLPEGQYRANHFSKRSDKAMVRDGVGFSVNLADKWDANLNRMRTLLRIHPDGGSAGTQGCVGILEKVQACHDQLASLFPNAKTLRWLEVSYVATRKDLILTTDRGVFFWS